MSFLAIRDRVLVVRIYILRRDLGELLANGRLWRTHLRCVARVRSSNHLGATARMRHISKKRDQAVRTSRQSQRQPALILNERAFRGGRLGSVERGDGFLSPCAVPSITKGRNHPADGLWPAGGGLDLVSARTQPYAIVRKTSENLK
jgi:hypothetical protein